MGGVFAGVFRTPMTAVFMVFELSATHVIIVPAMITATLGFLVARMFQRTPLLAIVAEDEGAVLPSAQAQREEEPLRVEHAMGRDVPELLPRASLAEARARAGRRRHVRSRSCASTAVGWAAFDGHAATAGDPAESGLCVDRARLVPLPVAHPDEPLDTILRLLARHPIVPVVSRLNPQHRLGAVTLADVHRAYGLRETRRRLTAAA